VLWKRVEPVVDSVFETGWEHATQDEVIMRVDYHLVLVLPEVLRLASIWMSLPSAGSQVSCPLVSAFGTVAEEECSFSTSSM